MVACYAFFVSLFLFFGLPIIILIVGFVLFFVRSRHRRTVGAVFVVVRGLEFCFWLIVAKITIASGFMAFLATLILGFVSLYSAGRIH